MPPSTSISFVQSESDYGNVKVRPLICLLLTSPTLPEHLSRSPVWAAPHWDGQLSRQPLSLSWRIPAQRWAGASRGWSGWPWLRHDWRSAGTNVNPAAIISSSLIDFPRKIQWLTLLICESSMRTTADNAVACLFRSIWANLNNTKEYVAFSRVNAEQKPK